MVWLEFGAEDHTAQRNDPSGVPRQQASQDLPQGQQSEPAEQERPRQGEESGTFHPSNSKQGSIEGGAASDRQMLPSAQWAEPYWPDHDQRAGIFSDPSHREGSMAGEPSWVVSSRISAAPDGRAGSCPDLTGLQRDLGGNWAASEDFGLPMLQEDGLLYTRNSKYANESLFEPRLGAMLPPAEQDGLAGNMEVDRDREDSLMQAEREGRVEREIGAMLADSPQEEEGGERGGDCGRPEDSSRPAQAPSLPPLHEGAAVFHLENEVHAAPGRGLCLATVLFPAPCCVALVWQHPWLVARALPCLQSCLPSLCFAVPCAVCCSAASHASRVTHPNCATVQLLTCCHDARSFCYRTLSSEMA